MTKVSDVTVKSWKTFTELLSSVGGLEVLARNPSEDVIYRIQASILSGGTDSGENWSSSVTYNTGDVVIFSGAFWESLQDNNLNNPPVDGSFWTEVEVSTANGFGRYAPGLYTVDPTVVVNGDSFYVLSEATTLPFNSVDFATELANGDWINVVGVTESKDVVLADSSTETPSGVPTTQNLANEEFTANINAINDAIARLANASLSIIGDPLPVPIITTEANLDFTTTAASTDTTIIESDDVNNEVDLKVSGRYVWTTSLEIVNSSTNTDHSVTIRSRRVSDDAELTSRQVDIPSKTTRTDFRAVFYDLAEGEEPQSVYITLEGSSNTALTLNKFETTLSIGSVAGATTDVNVKISDNDTVTGKLNDKLKVGNEISKEIENSGGNENILLTFKNWFYNAARTYKAIFDLSNLTADRAITWQDKDGTVAMLDDVGSATPEWDLNAATSWDGTSYAPDMTASDVDERIVNDLVTTITLANPTNVSTTKGRKKHVVIDNSANTSAISVISFGTDYNFPTGVRPTGMAAGEIATLELFNNSGTVRCDWSRDE